MATEYLNNKFLEEVALGTRTPINCKCHCLKNCKPKESPYCIARALIEAQQGKFDNGFVFCGSNAWRTKEDGIIGVKELFGKLDQEYAENKRSD